MPKLQGDRFYSDWPLFIWTITIQLSGRRESVRQTRRRHVRILNALMV